MLHTFTLHAHLKRGEINSITLYCTLQPYSMAEWKMQGCIHMISLRDRFFVLFFAYFISDKVVVIVQMVKHTL